jgi:Tol biopolymer transport system component
VRAILVAAATTLVAGVLAGAVDGASASRIAFTNNRAIWVIGSDGSGLRQVTHGGYSDGGVAWSQDGTLLAFTRYTHPPCPEDQTQGDLYLIRTDGRNQRRLTKTGCMFSPPSHPAFAPRGQKLAFDDDMGIVLAQAPGWQPRSALPHGLFPSWAPDARRLVEADTPNSIEVLDTVTHRTRSLGQNDFAQWSHDGKHISCVFSGNQIWTMDPAGGHRVHVTTAKGHISSLSWSPGDDRLAFSAGGKTSTSWVVSAKGGKQVKLGAGAFPAWAPDGTELTVELDLTWLYLVRADGSGRHRLTKGFGAAWAPN